MILTGYLIRDTEPGYTGVRFLGYRGTYTLNVCEYYGCLVKEGEHEGQAEVVISNCFCDDTYYACLNPAGGDYKLTIPDECCPVDCRVFVEPADEWVIDTEYAVDDIVQRSTYAVQFTCIKAHTSNDNNQPKKTGPIKEAYKYWRLTANRSSAGADCENWDDYPPWGGGGCSPAVITVTFSGVVETCCGEECEIGWPSNLNRSFTIPLMTSWGNCQYRGSCDGWTIVAYPTYVRAYIRFEDYYGPGDPLTCIAFDYAGEDVCALFGISFDNEQTYDPEGDECIPSGFGCDGHAIVEVAEPTYTQWLVSTVYVVDNVVVNNSVVYRCIQGHTSTTDDEPGTGANWETYWVVMECT